MIVHHDHSVSGRNHRWTEDIAGVSNALIYAAARDLLHPKQMVARIQENDAERFLVEGPHFRGHQIVNQFGRVEFLARQTFFRQALAEPEGGHQLNRFGCSNSVNQFDFFYGAPAQTGERTVSLQKLASYLDRVRSGHTSAEQDSDQLGVSERSGAATKKFFARPLILRHLADFCLSHSKSAREGGGSLHGARQMCLFLCLCTELVEQLLKGIAELEK